jgi:hypothetical protein
MRHGFSDRDEALEAADCGSRYERIGPALFEAGAWDLRTYTFLPWSQFVHSTPGVSHDNPTYRRYHGADTVEPSGR